MLKKKILVLPTPVRCIKRNFFVLPTPVGGEKRQPHQNFSHNKEFSFYKINALIDKIHEWTNIDLIKVIIATVYRLLGNPVSNSKKASKTPYVGI